MMLPMASTLLAPASAGAAAVTLSLFVTLAVILVAAKLAGEAAARLGQPAVLGELVVGVVLGGSVLGLVPGTGPVAELLRVFAEFGLLLLLLEIGLGTDLEALFGVGPTAAAVAIVGVLVPLGLGTGYWTYLAPGPSGGPGLGAVFVGAALTATSVGITARVFRDLGQMQSLEARIVIGAAIIDDILGLVILGVVSTLAAGAPMTAGAVGLRLGVAVAFLVVAILLGRAVIPRTFAQVERLRIAHALVAFALAFMLSLAALADGVGSAPIIGAFAAGIVLSGVNRSDIIVRELEPVAALFTPIFFVSVGAMLDLSLLNPSRDGAGAFYVMAGSLTLLAIAGKLVAGWAAPWARYRRVIVGVGMMPRGEVGLVFADVGVRAGVLSADVFGAVLVMVMVTTFLAPPVLARLLGPNPTSGRAAAGTSPPGSES
jgi:Kef-type K+ transport system membrane component KefB